MDVCDIRGAVLDVITEEVLSGDEDHDGDSKTGLSTEPFVVVSQRRKTVASTFQRFSVDTNESLSFEACVTSDEEEPVSPTSDEHDNVFDEDGDEVRGRYLGGAFNTLC